jgi:hypothetical protein
MSLKPQDIVVLLKLISSRHRDWTYSLLSYELSISSSEVHSAIQRASSARLIDPETKKPFLKSLEEFLIHGVKYAFPLKKGEITRGLKTTYAAPPLSALIQSEDDIPPVWPDPEGETRGYSVFPLYKTVPKAAKIDNKLYEMLALLDAIRDGRPRETKIAIEELKKRLFS